ncbi:MAG: polysaccharide deacetylase family protein, partial [Hyphomicrobiaceae bacterium]
VTGPVLDTLDRFCTKATFFQVGKMALAHPRMAREVVARGHTVGSHTWSHPRGFNKLPLAVAKDEVERGFAAIALAVGQHVAPFFRFPGLGDGAPSLRYLKSRGIGTFSVDVVSEDSFIASSERLAATVLARVEQRQRGIILFHDIKPQTARALPIVLQELKKRGYRVVHLKARQMLQPEPAVLASLRSSYAHAKAIASNRKAEDIGAVAIYGSGSGAAPPVTILAPPQRQLTRTGTRQASGNAKSSGRADGRARAKPVRAKGGDGWATTVHRPPAGEASP